MSPLEYLVGTLYPEWSPPASGLLCLFFPNLGNSSSSKLSLAWTKNLGVTFTLALTSHTSSAVSSTFRTHPEPGLFFPPHVSCWDEVWSTSIPTWVFQQPLSSLCFHLGISSCCPTPPSHPQSQQAILNIIAGATLFTPARSCCALLRTLHWSATCLPWSGVEPTLFPLTSLPGAPLSSFISPGAPQA